MNKLPELCQNLKKDFKPRDTNKKKPARCWSEKDVLNGKIIDAFVIIFKTRGCSWALNSGCSMCGYFNQSIWDEVTDEDLISQYKEAKKRYQDEKLVKIFTSGSFLDDKEISPKVRQTILKDLSKTAEKVSVESRPEYVTEKSLKEVSKSVDLNKFEIGIGLETANDDIRKFCINKGFSFNDFLKASELIKNHDISLKTYILIKPPFITEKQSINDVIETVEKIKNRTDLISLNPTTVQRNTVVEYLWKRNKYRPPWLFSIVEILKKSRQKAKDVFIKCDTVGGGSIRGPHNCKKCDDQFIKAISDFSLNQDLNVFEKLDCSCKEKWLDQLDIEYYGFGSLANMYGR